MSRPATRAELSAALELAALLIAKLKQERADLIAALERAHVRGQA